MPDVWPDMPVARVNIVEPNSPAAEAVSLVQIDVASAGHGADE
jgi:hypothetical protein